MRFLFYASNGLGIGHLSRLLSVAQSLSEKAPASEILFLTQSEAGPFPETFPFYAIRVPGRNRARTGGLTAKSYLQTVRPLILQAIAAFDPHLMVTDTFPEGPEKELSPAMEWPIHKAFIFREQHARRTEDPYMQQALRRYNRILVPHDEGTVPIPAFLKNDPRLRWTGPVLPLQPLLSRKEARERLGIPPDQKTLLLSFGGGGDPEGKRRAKDVALFLRRKHIPFFYASGPLNHTLPEGIHASEWLPLWPVRPFLQAFDGAIAGGGYNTVHELLEARIPAFLCGFSRALDPQGERIERLAGEGLVMALKGHDNGSLEPSLDIFLDRLPELMESARARRPVVYDGSRIAAGILLEIFQTT